MRMYYIFNIKKDVYNLYRHNAIGLYKVLENLYFMHQEEVGYGFSLFKQLTNKIKVQELNNQIYIPMHKELIYSKLNNEHIINDLYHDEVSILKVKSSYLLIESNKSYTSYFKLLNMLGHYYFVCDFKEKDFFFLDEMKNWQITQ